jgi:primosomal protein N' (replication factor Y)
VVLDLAPVHLDHEYDYLVPEKFWDTALPGVRIRVRFGRQTVDGFIVARVQEPEHQGTLAPISTVVSTEQVLTPEVYALAKAVAERWAGTVADVLRLAIPGRHARTEKEEVAILEDAVPAGAEGEPRTAGSPDVDSTVVGSTVVGLMAEGSVPCADGSVRGTAGASIWTSYPAGPAFLSRIASGDAPKAVWTPLPGDWEQGIVQAARTAYHAQRGVLIVAPDSRDVTRILDALESAGVPAVGLRAEDGPAQRYRSFLAVARGHIHVAVGTRSAAYAPVRNLGLVVCWGEGESSLHEPHAPYPHTRDVLAMRSSIEACALLVGSVGRTTEAQMLLTSGWAREIVAERSTIRARAPRVRALTTEELASYGPGAAARIPHPAWAAARQALDHGPVLVQVPRTGYVPMVACAHCREPASCSACHGPLSLPSVEGFAQCRWCARLAGDWHCSECGSNRLRAVTVGTERTAEELGRAFPGVPVRISSARVASGILDTVPDQPALIVATPGAEPTAERGYSVALILDAAVSTSSIALDSGIDALYRWLTVAHRVVPASEGGQVLLVGDAEPRVSQALVQFNPGWFAARELEERSTIGLPPTTRFASVTGDRAAVHAVMARCDLAEGNMLGPTVCPPRDEPRGVLFDEPQVRAIIRVPAVDGMDLARQLKASMVIRSASREHGTVRVRLDDNELE